AGRVCRAAPRHPPRHGGADADLREQGPLTSTATFLSAPRSGKTGRASTKAAIGQDRPRGTYLARPNRMMRMTLTALTGGIALTSMVAGAGCRGGDLTPSG